jgi:hypothetical protein
MSASSVGDTQIAYVVESVPLIAPQKGRLNDQKRYLNHQKGSLNPGGSGKPWVSLPMWA